MWFQVYKLILLSFSYNLHAILHAMDADSEIWE